jgi:hypothetical protein
MRRSKRSASQRSLEGASVPVPASRYAQSRTMIADTRKQIAGANALLALHDWR